MPGHSSRVARRFAFRLQLWLQLACYAAGDGSSPPAASGAPGGGPASGDVPQESAYLVGDSTAYLVYDVLATGRHRGTRPAHHRHDGSLRYTEQQEDGRGSVTCCVETSLGYACLREKPLPRVVVGARVDGRPTAVGPVGGVGVGCPRGGHLRGRPSSGRGVVCPLGQPGPPPCTTSTPPQPGDPAPDHCARRRSRRTVAAAQALPPRPLPSALERRDRTRHHRSLTRTTHRWQDAPATKLRTGRRSVRGRSSYRSFVRPPPRHAEDHRRSRQTLSRASNDLGTPVLTARLPAIAGCNCTCGGRFYRGSGPCQPSVAEVHQRRQCCPEGNTDADLRFTSVSGAADA